MTIVKPGAVFVNTGFEAFYKSKFYHAVVRIMSVNGDEVIVRSLCDTKFGYLSYGGPHGSPFKLSLTKDFKTGRFRPWKKEDLQTLIAHRISNRLFYGD